ncbi:MAG: LysM peptidoglycan-binding domain-containing protein [Treponema sp.]|nr:LysM peptidoglycan-binding domain-containing protein [Treponema sp.]
MKKITVGLVLFLAIFMLFSCKTSGSGVKIEGDVTQDKVNTALGTIYDTYRSKLDMTGAQSYTVASGDTLSAITRKYYGALTGVGDAGPNNGFHFPVIMLASGNKIVDPDLIEPGMQLKIPDLQKNLANPVSRQAIKDCLNDVAYVYNRKGVAATEAGLKKLAASL